MSAADTGTPAVGAADDLRTQAWREGADSANHAHTEAIRLDYSLWLDRALALLSKDKEGTANGVTGHYLRIHDERFDLPANGGFWVGLESMEVPLPGLTAVYQFVRTQPVVPPERLLLGGDATLVLADPDAPATAEIAPHAVTDPLGTAATAGDDWPEAGGQGGQDG